ncbi:hypothetical protein FRC08_018435 [Ceratobasidium sp. 394]|nr:hypothetical protein FRC08_018435 [Ceratobasidium sp. 394]
MTDQSKIATLPIPMGVPCWLFSVHAGTALSLDSVATFREDHTPLKACRLNGSDNQKWILQNEGDKVTIKNVASGTYLGYHTGMQVTFGMTVTANANPVQFEVRGNNEKGFSFIVPSHQGSKAVDLHAWSTEDNAEIAFYDSHDGANQKWVVVLVPDHQGHRPKWDSVIQIGGRVRIRNAKTSTSLDSGAQDTLLYGQPTIRIDNQSWVLEPAGRGYRIKSSKSNRYVFGEPGAYLKLGDVGTEVVFEGNSQDGYYIIDAGNINHALELEQGSDKKDTKTHLVPGRRQKWFLDGY